MRRQPRLNHALLGPEYDAGSRMGMAIQHQVGHQVLRPAEHDPAAEVPGIDEQVCELVMPTDERNAGRR